MTIRTDEQLDQRPTTAVGDVLRALSGVPVGSRVERLRDARPVAREDAQATYDYLFHPVDDGEVALVERLAVATFVAGVHGHEAASAHYGQALADAGAGPELVAAVGAETVAGRTEGPYGTYREEGLAHESVPGPEHRVAPQHRAILGERLAAALEHAHLLVLHPRDSRPERLERLVAAGWSATGIVTLSQLVAFLAFQLRAATGLAVLHATLNGDRA
ncbi:CMD domain protein [Georgenia sunbinii]|uniref:CMD domain protein n=1 Tax=Georgenia sunbinii TaxID=3117728 RepID=UPI002F26DEDF